MKFKRLIIENPTQCPYRINSRCDITGINCSHTAEFPYSCNLDDYKDMKRIMPDFNEIGVGILLVCCGICVIMFTIYVIVSLVRYVLL